MKNIKIFAVGSLMHRKTAEVWCLEMDFGFESLLRKLIAAQPPECDEALANLSSSSEDMLASSSSIRLVYAGRATCGGAGGVSMITRETVGRDSSARKRDD